MPNISILKRVLLSVAGVTPAQGGGGLQPFVQNVPQVAIVASRGMMPIEGTIGGLSLVSGDTSDMSGCRNRHRIGRFSANKIRSLFSSGVIAANGNSWFRQPQNLSVKWAFDTGATNWKLGDDVVVPSSGKVLPGVQILPADLGIGSFGAGAGILSRTEVLLSAGQSVHGGHARSVTTTNQAENVLKSIGQASQVNQAGDLATASRTALTLGYGPQAVLGEWVASRDLSIILGGDSFMRAAGDGTGLTTQYGEGNTGGGFGVRACYSVGGAGKTVPWMNMANGGQRVHRAVEAIALSILADILPYATDYVCNYFYNDKQAAGRTQEQILADLLTLARFVNSYGVRFHWCTPFPATQSNDSYASPGGQTLDAGALSYAAAAAFVTAGMLAAATNDPATAASQGRFMGGVANTRAAVTDPTEPDKWITNGTANYAVAIDNVHTNATGAALAAVPLNTYLNALSIPA